jgi:glycogen debranching enzyme
MKRGSGSATMHSCASIVTLQSGAYGDLDGDGLQEYQTRSAHGLENQGWKDSGDAIVYPDGSRVPPSIALCELQGYVFDAWLRMAEVFTALGEVERATDLR